LQGMGALPQFAQRRLFLVFTHGVTFSGYGTDWCGYHGSWGRGRYFAIIPFPTAGGCGSGDAIASWQSVTAHEIDEAATDPADGNGWRGGHPGGELERCIAGNALGHGADERSFGRVGDGRPFWIAAFNGDGRGDVRFYTPRDGNWWLGVHHGTELRWLFAGST